MRKHIGVLVETAMVVRGKHIILNSVNTVNMVKYNITDTIQHYHIEIDVS